MCAVQSSKWWLDDRLLPDVWMNLAALIPDEYPRPVLGDTDQPASFEALARIYTEECARIERLDGPYGTDEEISIPGPVMDQYRKYRPTPLFRAKGLERALDYGGRILYKREDGNPTGSHKPNTAFPQAYYAKQQGLSGVFSDTGAGQWGAAVALACHSYGLDNSIFMTRNSYDKKPYRRYLMRLAGGVVHSSPSGLTEKGRTVLARDSEHIGSLGIGMGEAMEMVSRTPETRLLLGCMSYYAALHQTIIGQELVLQLEAAECEPDILIACVGGGTNLVGFMAPFLKQKLQGASGPSLVAAESANVPVLTKGEYRYDYADAFGLTFKLLMYTLGMDHTPDRIHAGGLRYHGKSAILSLMVRKGLVKPQAITQEAAFEAGRKFFHVEGVVPAPESAHAIAATIAEVEKAKLEGVTKDIVFCLSGTGLLDLQGYADALRFANGTRT